MIHFFRQIRKKLSDSNQFLKYSKYAVGEILLVVIGILIALAINNFNEERKNRRVEVSILKELNKDFINNNLQFTNIKNTYRNGLAAIEKIISFIPYDQLEFPVDSFYKYRPLAFKTATFDAANGTVESIISSSTFTYISNDTLRNYLLSWKDVLRDYKEEESTGWTFLEDEILPFEYTYFDKLNELNPENIKPLQSRKFKNLLVLRRVTLRGILSSIDESKIEATMEEIIRLTKIDE